MTQFNDYYLQQLGIHRWQLRQAPEPQIVQLVMQILQIKFQQILVQVH